MGKISIEVCLISARGLRRTISSLWKLQWFAVGWIDPEIKYCTKIYASGNPNPSWKTKFSILVDTSECNFQDLALHVEVYSREPIFLRKKLTGTATIALKEFLEKYMKYNSQVMKPIEEVGSFQLRAKSSNKPQGFVDISIRISAEKEEHILYPGDDEGFKLNSREGITLPKQYAHPVPYPEYYSQPSVAGPSYAPGTGSGCQPPRIPPPLPLPPPASNVGYKPTFPPRTDHLPSSYINISSSGAAPGRAYIPGFGLGVGGGTFAAGAVIFGDDIVTGFDFPGSFQDASLQISTDPPF